MKVIAAVSRFASSLRRWVHRRGGSPRVVRRVDMECPHGRGLVQVDLLLDRAGRPEAVVRCTKHEKCPPTCDQACRRCAEAVLRPAEALIIYPGGGPFHDEG
jgi:hypothetical protein